MENEKNKLKKEIDLDDVLTNELGEFGWFQIRNLLLVCIPIIVSAFLSDYIFTASAIPHRCRIPECGENSKLEIYEPTWIAKAIPETDSEFSSCERFLPQGGNGSLNSCSENLFNHNETVGCDSFVYSRDNSIVYDFDLGCQEWLRVLTGTMSSVGSLLVLPITGYISDRFGRKLALLINAFNVALFGLIRAFSTNYTMFLVLQTGQTTLGGGLYSAAYIFGAELVGPKYRVMASVLLGVIFSSGLVLLGAIAWVIPPWRTLLMVLYISSFVTISYYWILSESVRWLISKRKFSKAKVILETVARVNKTKISDNSLNSLLNPPRSSISSKGENSGVILTVLRSGVLLRRVCTTPIWWITATFVYYGLSINSTSLSETMYVNYILTTAIEIPGGFAVIIPLNLMGRKKTLCLGYMLSGICNVVFVFIPSDVYVLRLIIFLLGKFSISGVMTSVYLYTSELYPTEYRHTLLAFSSMIGRLGSILAPLTPVLATYWQGIPSMMFGVMGLLSGLLVLTQPETLGTKLPDTLEEAEALGSNLLLVCIPIIVSAFLSDYIFTASAIPHRCRIPECGENSKLEIYEPTWIAKAIPETDSEFSSCERFLPQGGNGSLNSCSENLFNHNETVGCDSFVYSRDNSIVYDFDLGCQEWLRVLTGTMSSVGSLLVLPITGYISDRFGRKLALLINAFNVALFGLIRAFSTNYTMFLVLQTGQTTLGGGLYSAAYIFGAELVGPKYRVMASVLLGVIFSSGLVLLGAIAWVIPPWRTLLMVLYISSFVTISYYWILSESVRWLISKRKFSKAKVILETVARVNKTKISDNSLNSLLNPPRSSISSKGENSGVILTVLRSGVLLRRVCTTPIWWITATFVYYGLSINSTSLSETMYVNYILTTAIEIPGGFAVIIPLNLMGRKKTLCLGYMLSGICNVVFVFIPSDVYVLRLIIFLLGKFSISGVMTSVYLYTSELYPTEYRHTLLAFSSMIGRLGSILAPLTPVLATYWQGIPSMMFGVMGLLSGLLVLTQPETLGTKLPDTLEEAEALGSV